MDLHTKQWRNQDESDPQQHARPSGKIPKLLQLDHHQPLHLHPSNNTSALPFFVTDQPNLTKFSNLSQLPDSPSPCKFPRMGSSYFSLAQWQELELQALIYRYMLAGAAVPQELLQPIKKSLLLHSSPHFLHHPLQQYSFYQPALLQAGCWGRVAMDLEPGRCRRTDGKKWRCSRDIVAGQKYCERHVHRGRNRSRKPVETPTSTYTTTTATTNIPLGVVGGALGSAAAADGVSALNTATAALATAPLAVVADGNNSFSLSGQSPSMDLLHLHHGPLDSKIENKSLLGGSRQNEVGARSDGHILRPFFEDWPRSVQKPDNPPRTNASPINSSTCLSISMPGIGIPSSDISLKLATGNGDEPGPRGNEREQPQVSWASGWASAAQVGSMGGPLAEALRSSTSNCSPTSVLHQLPGGSGSEASFVSS